LGRGFKIHALALQNCHAALGNSGVLQSGANKSDYLNLAVGFVWFAAGSIYVNRSLAHANTH
jgi:ABC-type thiamine transport system ATPase subunit